MHDSPPARHLLIALLQLLVIMLDALLLMAININNNIVMVNALGIAFSSTENIVRHECLHVRYPITRAR